MRLYCTCKHLTPSSTLRVETGKFLFRARVSLCRELEVGDLGTRLEKDPHLYC